MVARVVAKSIPALPARNTIHGPWELLARIAAIDNTGTINTVANKITVAIGIVCPLIPVMRQIIAIVVDITGIIAEIRRILGRQPVGVDIVRPANTRVAIFNPLHIVGNRERRHVVEFLFDRQLKAARVAVVRLAR